VDKEHNELWLILDTVVMVCQLEKKEWYIRETNISPIAGFLNYDGQLILFNSAKFVNFNHEETTFDESINYYVKTQLLAKIQQFYKN